MSTNPNMLTAYAMMMDNTRKPLNKSLFPLMSL